MRWIETSSSPI